MADNTVLSTGAGGDTIATDDVAGVKYQRVKLVDGTADSTALIPGDAANGLDVDVTRLPALPAGTNNIGDVDVLTVPADPFGTNADVGVPVGAAGSMQAKFRLMTTQLDAITSAVQTLTNVVAGTEAQVDVVAALPAGTNNIGDVDVVTMPAVALDAATLTALETITVGTALPAGSANIGDVDIASIAAGSNAIGNVGVIPRTSGGLTPFRTVDLDETEEDVKTSAGQLFGWYIYNDGTGEVYVHVYNATAANVTVGTTTPALTFPIPAGAAANALGEIGIAFGTAISVAATTAFDGTGAPATNQVLANLLYS